MLQIILGMLEWSYKSPKARTTNALLYDLEKWIYYDCFKILNKHNNMVGYNICDWSVINTNCSQLFFSLSPLFLFFFVFFFFFVANF